MVPLLRLSLQGQPAQVASEVKPKLLREVRIAPMAQVDHWEGLRGSLAMLSHTLSQIY